MKSLFIKFVSAAFLAGAITACSDGGSGVAGIGGSGYISTGSVTGFGSVFVNGVEFETDSATFEVEDNVNATQADLRIGMVVQVEGSINNDGVSGTATRIYYGDDLEGPIAGLTTNLGGTTHSFSVLGANVVAKKSVTVFEDVTFDTLVDGQVVEISGFYDDSGTIQATFIERKTTQSGISEIKGVITGFTNISSNFTVRGVTVNAASAVIEDLPNGIQDNVLVEVKGTYNGTVLTASRVEGKDDSLNDDGSKVSVEGYITDFSTISSFKINGYPINASGAILEPLTLTFGNGIRVEAEGSIINGVLVATKIETRGGNTEVSTYVSSVNIANNSFDVVFNTNHSTFYVTVKITTATQMEDDIGLDGTLTLLELQQNDYVEVRGYETGTSEITATRVKRQTAEDIKLQGIVTAQSQDNSITVLGVEFPVDNVSADPTQYEDENEVSLTGHAEFISRTFNGQSVISIKDKASGGNLPGVADEVEIEIP